VVRKWVANRLASHVASGSFGLGAERLENR
jgi:hypothetical protein